MPPRGTPFGGVALAALALIVAGTGSAGGQERSSPAEQAPFRVVLSTDSGVDALSSRGRGGAIARQQAPARLHAELFHVRQSRRTTTRLWGGVTAGLDGSAQTAAQALSVDSTIVVNRRTHVNVDGRVSATPLDLFAGFGSAPASGLPVTDSSSSLATGRLLTSEAHASLTRTLSATASLEVEASHSTSTNRGASSVTTNGAGLQLRRRVGAFSSLVGGYGFTDARATAGSALQAERRHDVNVGFDYARPLPFAQHSTVSFATGSTIIATAESHRLRLAIAGSLGRALSRGWNARVEYNRPVEYVAGFTQPFLADAVTLRTTGRIGRGGSLTVASGFSRGSVGFNSRDGFASRTSSSQFAWSVARAWRIAFDVYDARYHFGATATRPSSVPEEFARRGARIGVMWSTPFGVR